MVALNFQKQFIEDVETGRKLQSIRAPWKNGKFPFKPECHIQLYYGMRTKKCRKLGDAICTNVQRVVIKRDRMNVFDLDGSGFSEQIFYAQMLHSHAQADGFEDWDAMVDWFEETHGLPFEGYLVKWARINKPVR